MIEKYQEIALEKYTINWKKEIFILNKLEFVKEFFI